MFFFKAFKVATSTLAAAPEENASNTIDSLAQIVDEIHSKLQVDETSNAVVLDEKQNDTFTDVSQVQPSNEETALIEGSVTSRSM